MRVTWTDLLPRRFQTMSWRAVEASFLCSVFYLGSASVALSIGVSHETWLCCRRLTDYVLLPLALVNMASISGMRPLKAQNAVAVGCLATSCFTLASIVPMIQQKFVCMGVGLFFAGMLGAVTREFPRQAAIVSTDNASRARHSLDLLVVAWQASNIFQACMEGGIIDRDRSLELLAFIDVLKNA